MIYSQLSLTVLLYYEYKFELKKNFFMDHYPGTHTFKEPIYFHFFQYIYLPKHLKEISKHINLFIMVFFFNKHLF